MKYNVRLDGHRSSYTKYHATVEVEADSEEAAVLQARRRFSIGEIDLQEDTSSDDTFQTDLELDEVEVLGEFDENDEAPAEAFGH